MAISLDMNRTLRLSIVFAVVAALSMMASGSVRAQSETAKDHAKRILELLKQEKFEDIAREFNPQVAAAMTPQQLGEAWSRIKALAGDFKSTIDQTVMDQSGVTVVVTGCQFEKLALNYVLALDGNNKIAGLRFVPRA